MFSRLFEILMGAPEPWVDYDSAVLLLTLREVGTVGTQMNLMARILSGFLH